MTAIREFQMDSWTQTQLDEERSDKSDKKVPLPAPSGDVSITCVLGLQCYDFAGRGFLDNKDKFCSWCRLFSGCLCRYRPEN